MRLGIYVGSFNPVHKGHIAVIDHLIDNDYVDKVMVIPTGNYWDKNNLIAIDKRIEMLRLYQSDKIVIDSKFNDIKYTYLLLRELVKEYNNDEIYLILGADNLINFDLWKEYKEIIDNYKIIILPRDNIDLDVYLSKYNSNHFIVADTFYEVNISSRMIRKLFREKEYDKVREYLDDKVIEYIKKYKLYL